MVVVNCHGDGVTGNHPGLGVLEVLHVRRGTCDGDTHFAGAKNHPISASPMCYDVNETLETFGGVGGDVRVVCDAAPAHVDVVAKLVAQLGLVHGGETGVNVPLEMTGRLHVALTISSFLSEGSSQFAIKLELAFCVGVGVLGVLENIASFPQLVLLADLDLAINRRKGSLSIKACSKAGLVLIESMSLALTSLKRSKEIGHSFCETVLVWTLRRTKDLFRGRIQVSVDNHTDVGRDSDAPVGVGLVDRLAFALVDVSGEADLDLLAGQVVDVLKEPVDKLKDGMMSFRPTISEMFNAQFVRIAGFTELHFVVDDVLEGFHCHRRNFS